MAEEKETGIEAMGIILKHTMSVSLAYLDKCVEVLKEMCDHGQEGVRKAALGALCRIVEGAHEAGIPREKVAILCKAVMHEALVNICLYEVKFQ